jgi:hypothetical protein
MTLNPVPNGKNSNYKISIDKNSFSFSEKVSMIYAVVTCNMGTGPAVTVAEIQAGVFHTANFSGESISYLNSLADNKPDPENVFQLSAHAINLIMNRSMEKLTPLSAKAFVDLSVVRHKPDFDNIPIAGALRVLRNELEKLNPVVVLYSKETPLWTDEILKLLEFEEVDFGLAPNLQIARWARTSPKLRLVS